MYLSFQQRITPMATATVTQPRAIMDDPTAKPTSAPVPELVDGIHEPASDPETRLESERHHKEAEDVSASHARADREGIKLTGGAIRKHAARGTLINTGFMVALSFLGFIRGFVLAAFLTREDYGIWGVLVVSIGTVLWLKQVGIGDKFIQQDDEDQEAAFQRAWTLEVMSSVFFLLILAACLPLFAKAYGEPELILPGLVTIFLVLPSGMLKAPLWVAYRRMEFVKQRTIQAIDPIVGFVVAISLAIAGAGYWSMIVGLLVGGWTAAAVAVATSPYKLRFRYDKGTLREYWAFSWPIFITSGSSLVIAQSATFATEAHLGLAAVGAVALASSVTNLTHRLNGLVSGTIYPAVCAVKDRLDLLFETFVKTNRLALMWATPFGIALALFCGDLVSFGIGEKWRPAVELLQVYGVTAAIGHIGFNWDAYFRARGDTKPMAVTAVATMLAFLCVGIPLLFEMGLRGLALGVAAQSFTNLCFRAYYLQKLFHGFKFIRHAIRAITPTIPATALVVLLRVAEPWDKRTVWMALGELAVYVLATAVATWRLEKPLLREVRGYIAVRTPPVTA